MRTALVALVSGLLLAACTPAVVDKSGGSGPVITLSLATSDQPGGPVASTLDHATPAGTWFLRRLLRYAASAQLPAPERELDITPMLAT